LPKLRETRRNLADRPVDLSIDGGVKADNARTIADHGADILVAGSAIFGAPDPGSALRAIRQAAGS
jgi:ribulose-phosphate 3-epimerase